MTKSTGETEERHIQARKIKRRQAPAKSVESRENQIISLAYDLAEKRIRAGTATSQEVSHFLKMGSSQAQLERVKLENENKLLQAKTDALQSAKKIEELYEKAIQSMAHYQGRDEEDE